MLPSGGAVVLTHIFMFLPTGGGGSAVELTHSCLPTRGCCGAQCLSLVLIHVAPVLPTGNHVSSRGVCMHLTMSS